MTSIMDLEIMSKEYIRPSSPTPPHLKTHMFSVLDHMMPPVYVPMILLYPPPPPAVEEVIVGAGQLNKNHQRSQTLKQSLSDTLTRFYPLAGRINSHDNHASIDCNDEGAYFIEANVHDSHLSEFLEHPDLSLIPKFLPPVASSLEYDTATTGVPAAEVVMIQLTNFACGGFVIGALVSHMIVDGIAISTFLKAWAAAAAAADSALQQPEVVMPNFDAGPSMFPPNPNGALHPREATMRGLYRRFVNKGVSVTNRFVFKASAVAKLKEKAGASLSSYSAPTRVEAISAFIWKRAMAAWNNNKSQSTRPSLITHAVNLRPRTAPPLSGNCMGNFVCLAAAICDEDEVDLSSLVRKMREATRKINGDLMRDLQAEGIGKLFQDISISISAAAGDDIGGNGMDFIGFTSTAYSGVYDADFGWGKPRWVIPVHEAYHEPFFVNVVRLMDTGQGNGSFEAWISFGPDDMAFLQQDQDLLAFASVNPSPLCS